MSNIIIFGGDKRQEELFKIFLKKGLKCRRIFSSENDYKIDTEDIVILPLPISKDGINVYSSDDTFKIKTDTIIRNLDSTNILFGGGIPESLRSYLNSIGVEWFDYLECDTFVEYNAYLTGIGAVKLLYEQTDEILSDKKVLVTGYGRVAKYTSDALKNSGCDVYVTARNSLQLVKAQCKGYKTIDFENKDSYLYLFDYVFNTIPENIFTSDDVIHIKGKYVELASYPFGVCKEYFMGGESSYINGGALPGRYLPYSAALKLAETTIEIINLRNGGD